MSESATYVIEWAELRAFEPAPHEVPAARLAAAYNDPQNARLLGHTAEITVDDVAEHYAKLAATGAHAFILECDGALAGDADLRDVANGEAEFAFLIAAPSQQGKGLGTRFATMIHALAFGTLGLERVYASVIPENVASRRVFEKLGYVPDATTARGDEGDIVLRLDRDTFVTANAATLAQIRIARR